jgi:hypothetical protein
VSASAYSYATTIPVLLAHGIDPPEIAHDEFGVKANDAVASASELAISAGIRGHAAGVTGTKNRG